MSATSLRRVAPKRLRRRGRAAVEELREAHSTLVAERQKLRAAGVGFEALERNRLEIVHCQWALARALIALHMPRRTARSAA